MITQEGMDSDGKGVDLHLRKKFFTVRMMRCWNRLSREPGDPG